MVYIYANIGGILIVNVSTYIYIYTIHGSYGYYTENRSPLWLILANASGTMWRFADSYQNHLGTCFTRIHLCVLLTCTPFIRVYNYMS